MSSGPVAPWCRAAFITWAAAWGREAAGVADVGVGTAGQKQVDDLGAVEHGRDHQGGLAIRSAAIDLGAAVEQQTHHRQVALEGGSGQRCLATVIGHFKIAIMVEQAFDKRLMPVAAGQHEKAVALVVAQGWPAGPCGEAPSPRPYRPARTLLKNPPCEGERVFVEREWRARCFIRHDGPPIDGGKDGNASLGEGVPRTTAISAFQPFDALGLIRYDADMPRKGCPAMGRIRRDQHHVSKGPEDLAQGPRGAVSFH